MPTHRLKVWPELYDEVAAGRKTFELRRRTATDPTVAVGDLLELAEWTRTRLDDSGFEGPAATGRSTRVLVTYVITAQQLADLGLDLLQPGVIVMGIQPEPPRIQVTIDGDGFTTEGWALWLEGWCDHADGEADGPSCCIWRQAGAAMRARHAELDTMEAMALTVGRNQAARGEAITPNVGAVLVMALERLTGGAS